MRDRCLSKSNKKFKHWGGRGISICDRWLKFENFLADMGDRPKGTTIDRIDNDKGYEPGNCRWATAKVQARGKLVALEAHEHGQIRWLVRSEKIPKTQIARFFGISPQTVARLVISTEG